VSPISDIVWVAIVAAIPVTLGLLGGAVRYVVSLILDAYKQQATATVEAKDRDLAAKDKLIGKLERRVERLDTKVDDQDGLIRDLRNHLRALGESA
jgi:ribosome-associated translation inhibitor RaiA